MRACLSLSLSFFFFQNAFLKGEERKKNKLKPSCVVRGKIFIMRVPLRESRLSFFIIVAFTQQSVRNDAILRSTNQLIVTTSESMIAY